MKISKVLLSGLLGTALFAPACSVERVNENPDDENAGFYYVGYVYDGVTAETLTDYNLTVLYDEEIDEFTEGGGGAAGTTPLTASVDDNGRYRVGPVGLYSDFTVEISAGDGYREFLSHNQMRTFVDGPDDQETELYEAYLFPTDIQTPAVTFELFSDIPGADRPTGQVRLTPDNGTTNSDLDLAGTLGASVNNQVWTNDLDAHFATQLISVEGGTLELEAGALVYGVTYDATVFSVDGHRYETFTFTAGLSGNQSVVLDELTKDSLQLVSYSVEDGRPSENGQVSFVFNRPIEFARNVSEGLIRESVDDGFSIDSINADGDLEVNSLTLTDEPGAQETGTSVTIEGNVLTLSWANQASNFETQDSDDIIQSVFWPLSVIPIQPADEPEADVTDLDDFAGLPPTLEVNLVAEPSL